MNYPVIHDLRDFDQQSGSMVERWIFNHRAVIIILCAAATIVLGFQISKLRLNASFEKTMPSAHPYIINYLRHQNDLKGSSNIIRIAVETQHGSIFNASFLETLQRINDEVFLIPGVDRPYMKSLWTPSTRWIAVTEDGYDGGPVIPDSYNGSEESVHRVRMNVERSNEIGRLVASDFKSTIILVPLMDRDPQSGETLDYGQFTNALELVRAKYQTDTLKLHITGFAKVAGDLIHGLKSLLLFFAIAVLLTASVFYWYMRCLRSTLLVIICSFVAVIWLLGLLPMFGYALDPYSILVPFLIFAIGMSHGAQKMNGISQDIDRGTHKLIAARYTFRRLFAAGLTALLIDVAGFAVLTVIPIKIIRELAITASMGVVVLIFTNLVLLPVLLSYVGVKRQTMEKSSKIYSLLARFTQRSWAVPTLLATSIMGAIAFAISLNLKAGDSDPGAPELRPDSRYNLDNAFMTAHYGAGSDTLIVMTATSPMKCLAYASLAKLDALEWQLLQLPEVTSTYSFASMSRHTAVGLNEGRFKWYDLPRTQAMLNAIAIWAPRDIFNSSCDLLPLYVQLRDHKADTLSRVTNVVETFAAANNSDNVKFLLGAGNAGIEAATNIVVRQGNVQILILVYAAVITLCFVAFRSWRMVACAVLPLALTSVLCEAAMVCLGIGLKVATLPVIALGVGIGVDYAIYVLTVMRARLREGLDLAEAYFQSLLFTGKMVALTGITLSMAVATWVLSPIKFQADMGLLLAFMFVFNMAGTLILSPALACLIAKE